MTSEELHQALAPLLASQALETVDVEVRAGVVRVTVDREGGVDMDALAQANRTVSAALDDLDPFPGHYTLEVSSPGLERRLRTPEHFARAVGETVSVRTLPGTGDVRRLQGVLVSADADGIVLEGPEVPGGSRRVALSEVERARTVFEWGAPPPPTRKRSSGAARAGAHPTTERVTTP